MAKRKIPKKGKRQKKGAITKRERGPKSSRSDAPEGDEEAAEPADSDDDDSSEADSDDDDSSEAASDDDDSSEAASDDDDSSEAASDDDDSSEAASDDDDSKATLEADHPSWVVSLLRLDEKWTWLETRVMFVALLMLTVVLCFWIAVRGMSEPLQAAEAAGTVFRGIVGAAALGGLVRFLSRGKLEEQRRNQITVLAVVVGLLTAKLWRDVGIDYFQGLLAWLQEGSTVSLFGGFKGISTRLTMLVALLGASLAAATGTHINIDVVVRFIPKSLRKTVAMLGAIATATVCFLASYGFLDFIAVTSFQADPKAPMTAKVGKINHEMGEQFFVWRKQMALDISALPHVLMGGRYDDPDRMNGREWNTFLSEGGFIERYGEEKIAPLRAPDSALDAPRVAFVAIPDGNPRGMLVHPMDLVFPFGFFMIALRVLLRAALVWGGAASASAHGEEEFDDPEDSTNEAATEGVS